ncbi:MAG: dTMP kinase [Armatimonadota bacterium]|nr:dTMP kinase [Armatimonadota bacterium]
MQVGDEPGGGFFVTIEGIEGAGKSTLARFIGGRLQSDGFQVIVTAEPGGDPVSEQIRRLLLNSADSITVRAELLLFEAARAQHVERIIKPALVEGKVVICDRFTDSSLAYQGWARGIDPRDVQMLNDYATAGLKPHLTLLLDLPPEVGLARTREVDRFSREGIEFHHVVREGYLAIAKQEPGRFVVIDAQRPFNEVAALALEVINSRLRAKDTS